MMRCTLVLAVALAARVSAADTTEELDHAFTTSMDGGAKQAKQSIAIGERLLAQLVKEKGERSREVVVQLQRLALARRWANDTDRARADLRRAAAAALASKLDEDDLLASLATDLEQLGALAEAEPLRRRALAIAENVKPGGNPSYMLTTRLDELATVLGALGNFDETLALRKRYVALLEQQQHWLLPKALIQLAAVHVARRELDAAELATRRALAVTDQNARTQPGNAFRAAAAQALSQIAAARGATEEARALLEQAYLVYEEAGAGVTALSAIADSALERGDLDDASALAERARALGDPRSQLAYDASLISAAVAVTRGDRDTAEVALRQALAVAPTPDVLRSLATLYLEIGDRARAESLILAAYNQSKDAIAKRYRSALGVLRVASQAAEANGHTSDAIRRYRKTFEVSEAFLRSVRLGVQEDRLLAILDELSAEHDQIWTLAAAHPKDRDAAALGLAVALLRKGRALDELSAAARAARNTDPEFQRLIALRHEYARIAISGVAGKRSRAELERDIANVERGLRASGLEPDALPRPDKVVAAVRKRLRANELLVEVVAYQPVRFADGAGMPAQPTHYLAFVLGAKRLDAVDLGSAVAIDKTVQELREQIDEGHDRSPEEPALMTAQRALYDLTLGKLAVDGTFTITLSLDGALQLVPFEVARDDRGELIEHHAFRYVTSGRDLLARPRKAGSQIRLIADPAFPTKPLRFGSLTIDTPERLPYTRVEAEDIAKLFSAAKVFVGERATSDALLAGPSPRILHVATHGVFLDDVEVPSDATRGVELASTNDEVEPARPNPMLRSALLLASGSRTESVLTAYRLADADLANTELVVLSACETGLGERKRNQGVFGLRRALLVAGASTVVTSLWRVNDQATRDLMVAYYKKLLAGHGRVAALREAELEIRKERPHPYFWGAFVAVGSASPLGH